ncbi:tRNA 2-thiouridine(34) synthase MnmA [Niameybacter massiliensis]|uniref:tRNA-specific 2-thiouridylase MnmA n=2 Tax=Lachnospirales TaxID=3085636 RepID=A0AA42J1Z3_9FIRM|nr:tRNA 2-thiouridine(34) synthase MnmA [Holtiella tumoricola]MDA3732905.1 tRNA 2-thiouridine(34) synthase MnmA [Holtiella tumoricola]
MMKKMKLAMPNSKGKVVVGMSGGVDSSVTAYLLQQQGYEVIGMTMQIWQKDAPEDNDGGCCGLSAVDDARRVCQKLDIPHYVINFRDDFKKHVIDYFIDEYEQGHTPNPCIACNRYVKWESMLHKALQIGADYIATGHYARVIQDEQTGRFMLKFSKTMAKDQTYALYNLTQHQLEHTLMPLGDYTKDEIRAIAKEIGLAVATKPDSQEICFVPDDDYAGYIERETGKKQQKGKFITKDGKVLGEHKGIIHYTIGQRKGLGISYGKPLFVSKIDPVNNTVVVGDNEDLFTCEVYANKLNFMPFEKLEGPLEVAAKIRYSHAPQPCTIEMVDEETLKCTFKEPQRAITPGQALVIYDGDIVVGGGTIIK